MSKYVNFEELLGKTLESIVIRNAGDGAEIIFTVNEDEIYRMYHDQDCCESVDIESIDGDIQDIENSPILLAEEVTNSNRDDSEYESETWTFYKLSTIKGSVTIRWHGVSNGYYSESVSFERV